MLNWVEHEKSFTTLGPDWFSSWSFPFILLLMLNIPDSQLEKWQDVREKYNEN